MGDGVPTRGEATPLLLGIDAGGTTTDAVLVIDGDEPEVVAWAKAGTTPGAPAIGIDRALDRLFADSGRSPGDVALVSLSTTFATNALVEGRGSPVDLIALGFTAAELSAAGIDEALRGGSIVELAGGHDSHGIPLADLDLTALDAHLGRSGAASGPQRSIAVVGRFSVRNPAHERAVADHVRAHSDRPVTCSHELSAELDGPRRAVTAALNAGLVGLVTDLVAALRDVLARRSIGAPLLVVRGDGSLVAAEVAVARPVETILSGPAASLVGAGFLAGAHDAVVIDMGGTTSDLAVLRDGTAERSSTGATVGGHRTMVRALDVTTIGLGGDSEVAFDDRGRETTIVVGPRRIVPVAALAATHPELVIDALRRDLAAPTPRRLAGGFVAPGPRLGAGDDLGAAWSGPDGDLVRAVADGPVLVRDVAPTRRHELRLDDLARRGVVVRVGLTPTDALLAVGADPDLTARLGGSPASHDAVVEAARAACELTARRSDRHGRALAPDGAALAGRIVERVRDLAADAVLALALADDGIGDRAAPPVDHDVVRVGLGGHRRTVAVDVRLDVPVVLLGGPASAHAEAVGSRLRTPALVPRHAEVANAVGAVVGRVRIERSRTITRTKKGVFRVDGVGHASLEDAAAAAEATLRREVSDLAIVAGGGDPDVDVVRADTVVPFAGGDLFVESVVRAVAVALPARGD